MGWCADMKWSHCCQPKNGTSWSIIPLTVYDSKFPFFSHLLKKNVLLFFLFLSLYGYISCCKSSLKQVITYITAAINNYSLTATFCLFHEAKKIGSLSRFQKAERTTSSFLRLSCDGKLYHWLVQSTDTEGSFQKRLHKHLWVNITI